LENWNLEAKSAVLSILFEIKENYSNDLVDAFSLVLIIIKFI